MAYIDGKEVLFSAQINGDNIAVVQETGESTEKVMSQKAVTDELNNKVPIIGNNTDLTKVYVQRPNNAETNPNTVGTISATKGANANTIPIRNDRSTISVLSDTSIFTDTDLVSKKYVDDKVSTVTSKLYKHRVSASYSWELDGVYVSKDFYSTKAEKFTLDELAQLSWEGCGGDFQTANYSTFQYTDGIVTGAGFSTKNGTFTVRAYVISEDGEFESTSFGSVYKYEGNGTDVEQFYFLISDTVTEV